MTDPDMSIPTDVRPLPELDARAHRAAAAAHAAVEQRPAGLAQVRRPAPSPRGRVVVALAAVLVLLAGGVAVALRSDQTERASTVAARSLTPLTPTVLPKGFSIDEVKQGNSRAIAFPSVLYATPQSSGGFGEPAVLISVGFHRGGTATSLQDRLIERFDRYPGAKGRSVSGQQGAVQINGWGVSPALLDAIAQSIDTATPDAGRVPKLPGSTLPAGMVRVGEPAVVAGGPLTPPPSGGYRETFGHSSGARAPGQPRRLDFTAAEVVDNTSEEALLHLVVAAGGRKVDINGYEGWILPGSMTWPADGSESMVWFTHQQVLRLDSTGISEAELLAAARSVRPIDASSPGLLQALLPDDTPVTGAGSADRTFGPVAIGYELVAQGRDYGGPWRVTVRPAAGNKLVELCARTLGADGCTEGREDLEPDGQEVRVLFGPDSNGEGAPALYVGVVGPEITGVRRRAPDGSRQEKGMLFDVGHGLRRRVFVIPTPQGTRDDQIEFTTSDGGAVVEAVTRPAPTTKAVPGPDASTPAVTTP